MLERRGWWLAGGVVAVAIAVVVLALLIVQPPRSLVPQPTATEIAVGGVRAAIVRHNLADARSLMPGGVVEPGWLPGGFFLTQAEYNRPGSTIGPIDSVDLYYQGPGGRNVHVWQTLGQNLGSKAPVGVGEVVPGVWDSLELPGGRLQLSTRASDGRTVTVDGNLPADEVQEIVQRLVTRAPAATRGG